MPIGRLFFEIDGDTSRLNASLQEAVKIAKDAGLKVTRAGQLIIAAFDDALNPTKRLAEQVKLLEIAGKSSSDIWQVMGEKMKNAADAARANSQAVDPLVLKHIELAKASQGSGFSFESLGKIIQDFKDSNFKLHYVLCFRNYLLLRMLWPQVRFYDNSFKMKAQAISAKKLST